MDIDLAETIRPEQIKKREMSGEVSSQPKPASGESGCSCGRCGGHGGGWDSSLDAAAGPDGPACKCATVAQMTLLPPVRFVRNMMINYGISTTHHKTFNAKLNLAVIAHRNQLNLAYAVLPCFF